MCSPTLIIVPPPFWDTCGKLQRFQSRAARVLTGANYDTSSADLLNMLSWDTLENRRSGAKSVLMYKILNDHTAPGLRGSFVSREIDQTNYHLRNTATDLTIPKPKREFLKKSFKYTTAPCSGINSQTKQNWPSRFIHLNQLLDNDMLPNYLYIVIYHMCMYSMCVY